MFGNQVTPAMAINEASFTIRVRDQTRLDFESLKEVRMIKMIIIMLMVMVISMVMVMVTLVVIVVVKVNFTVVAREVAAGGRESRASVVVHVRDLNDNPPIFLEVNFLKIVVNCDGMKIKYITFTESFSVTIRGLHQRRHPTRRNCCLGAGAAADDHDVGAAAADDGVSADDGDDDVGADDGDANGDDGGGDDDGDHR